MMNRLCFPVLAACVLVFAAVYPAGARQAHVFEGATIYPISGEPVSEGVLVIRDGLIEAVGSRDGVRIPDGAVRHDVSGKVILPGLVDTHSHIGRGDGGDRSGPLHPDVRIMDAIDARSSTLGRARAGGITTVNVMPGSGHLMSGQTVYLKLRKANTVYDMLFCDDATRGICGGMKMANGTNSLRDAPFPGTRARSAALVRNLFVKAQDYQRKIREAGDDASKLPARDLQMEALVQILNGERIVHFHTHRHDDVLTALRIAGEFGFRPVLHHVSEGWKVADEIAAAGVPASIIVLDSPGGKLEATGIRYDTGAVMERAGVDVAYHTDDGITDSRLFLRSAAFGVRSGMSREKALESLTLAGARMLGMEDRIGSLDPGKDADFIVLSGDPLSVYTHIEQTWVEGRLVYDRSNPDDYKLATGGYEVFRGSHMHHHDLGGE